MTANRPAAHHTNPEGPALTLASDGQHWMGTFAITVDTIVNDLLEDGEGFNATITLEEESREVRGCVQSPAQGSIVIVEDTTNEVHHVPVVDITRIDIH